MYQGNNGGGNFRQENRGALFPRQKTGPKSPDMGGDFTLTGEVLDYIKGELSAGATEIKFFVSAWREQSRNNAPRISLAIRPPLESQPGGQRPQRSGFQSGNAYQAGQQRQGGNSYQNARGNFQGNQTGMTNPDPLADEKMPWD